MSSQVGNSFEVLDGETIILICHFRVTVEGINFQWYHREDKVSPASIVRTQQSQISVSSNSTTSILTINNVQASHEGIYTCNASTALQSIQLNATIHHIPIRATTPKIIRTSPPPTKLITQAIQCTAEVRDEIAWPETLPGQTARSKCAPPAQGIGLGLLITAFSSMLILKE